MHIPPLSVLLRMSLRVKIKDYPLRVYELANHEGKAMYQQIFDLHCEEREST